MHFLRPVILAAACALAGVAAAQTYTPAPGADRTAPSAYGPRGADRRADWEARRQAHEAREAADLSTILRLRPEQQAGLRDWLDVRGPTPAARRGDERRSGAEGAPATTAQTLDREAARMTEREGRMRAHLDATRRFYSSLSPDQQAVFDALQRLHHGGGRGGWGRHGVKGSGMMDRFGPGGRGGASPLLGD